MKRRIFGLILAFVLFFSISPSLLHSVNAATELTSTPYPKIEYSYTTKTPVGTIRYISQITSSKYFNDAYWGKWKEQAIIECGTASMSMALSYVGVNKTPDALLTPKEGLTYYIDWGDAVHSSPSFSTAMKNYINGTGKYSPVVICLEYAGSYNPKTGKNNDHYILVVGKTSDNNYQYLDPASNKVGTTTISSSKATYGSSSHRIKQVHQRYNSKATPPCEHKEYTDVGVCKNCNKEFDFNATYKTDAAGYYKVNVSNGIYLRPNKPYAAADASTKKIIKGTKVEVLGSLTNAFGNKWYKVSYGTEIGYTSADNLTFDSYGEQVITCTLTSPAEGASVPKAAYPVIGTITSKYPLKEVRAYIDGKLYAPSVAGNNKNTIEIRGTDINYKLDFAGLSTGEHTIKIEAKDIHHDAFITICTRKFKTVSSSTACEHSYSSKVTTAANCGTAGVRTYTCSKCGANYKESIAATGKHSYTGTVTTAATCTAEGIKTYKCSVCSASYTEYIDKIAHSYGNWTTTTAAGCTTAGTQKKTCSKCGDVQTQSIGATGHSYGNWTTTIAAGCTTAGTQKKTCSKCGDVQTQSIGAVGHDYKATTIPATCTEYEKIC